RSGNASYKSYDRRIACASPPAALYWGRRGRLPAAPHSAAFGHPIHSVGASIMNALRYCQPLAQNKSIARRDALKAGLAVLGGAALMDASSNGAEPAEKPDDRRASPKRYAMKKSINLWAFPYPQRMTLVECLQLAKDAEF